MVETVTQENELANEIRDESVAIVADDPEMEAAVTKAEKDFTPAEGPAPEAPTADENSQVIGETADES